MKFFELPGGGAVVTRGEVRGRREDDHIRPCSISFSVNCCMFHSCKDLVHFFVQKVQHKQSVVVVHGAVKEGTDLKITTRVK